MVDLSTTPRLPNGETDNIEQTPVHVAEQLTGGGKTAFIALSGQIYTLRITRAGKLILTK